jgi:hypothetical protein
MGAVFELATVFVFVFAFVFTVGFAFKGSEHILSPQLLTSNKLITLPILLLSHIMCPHPVAVSEEDGRGRRGRLACVDVERI